MKDLAEKRNEDIEDVINKIHELVYYAWERGYKCGQADCEEPVEAEHKICSGDVVITPLGMKGIVIGICENALGIWASVYLKEYDVPQMEPLDNIKYTGKHVNVLNFFKNAFIDIEEVKKNET
jgi:hypothetical protein